MSEQEKKAWANLVVIGVTITTFFALLPAFGAQVAGGAFGLLGVLGLRSIWRSSQQTGTSIVFDERDLVIQAKSGVIAYSIFRFAFVGASIGLWLFYHRQSCISVDILPMYPLVSWIVFTATWSVATLVQYGREK